MAPTSQPQGVADTIRINNLELILPLLSGAQWPGDEPSDPVLQPLRLTLEICHDTRPAAASDAIDATIDYSTLAKVLYKRLSARSAYESLDHAADVVCQMIVEEYAAAPFNHFKLTLVQPKASLLCESLACSYTSTRVHGQWQIDSIQHNVKALQTPTIIGIRPYERESRQETQVSVEIDSSDLRHISYLPQGRTLVKQMYEAIYHSKYLTLEALASYIAKMVLSIVSDDTIPVQVKVSAAKPHAIALATSAEVIIERTSADFVQPRLPRGAPVVEDSEPNFDIAHTGTNQTAVLAFGSNIGDRFRNIEYALRLLEIPEEALKDVPRNPDAPAPALSIVDTSFLYETTAMYVTGQPPFINGACIVETNLSPLTLLRLLKKVEEIVGRVPTIRHGPRAVDVDLIFYGNLSYDTRPTGRRNDLNLYENQLIIPHARMAEREFVLRPLNDMIPDYVHPTLQCTVRELLEKVDRSDQVLMHKVMPFPKLPLAPRDNVAYHSLGAIPSTLTHWNYRTIRRVGFPTQIMATLNTTPDSFSDGSTHNTLIAAMEYVRDSVYAGASIIDIGGYSTRPEADYVSVEEELERVVPFVKAIRSGEPHTSNEEKEKETEKSEKSKKELLKGKTDKEGKKPVEDVLVSVDTFRPEVAEAAILAGANCINDVYAFTGQDSYSELEEAKVVNAAIMEKMKGLSRKYSVPAVLMHSRGDAGQNKDYSMYKYVGKEPVVEGVRVELGQKIEKIVKGKGGVRRWLVLVDPGIGFSKTLEDNLCLLKSGAEVTRDVVVGQDEEQKRNPLFGFPQLIGSSRKSFLGKILSEGELGRETEPNERTWATAAAVTCAIQQGAVVVRVHDVKEMYDVVKVADAIWR